MNDEYDPQYQLGVIEKKIARKNGEFDELVKELYELQHTKLLLSGIKIGATVTMQDNETVRTGIVTERSNKYDLVGKYPVLDVQVNLLTQKGRPSTKFAKLTPLWKEAENLI